MVFSKDYEFTSPTKPRSLFRAPKPAKPKKERPEWRLQTSVVSEFHKWQDGGWDFEFAGDMNAGKRNGARALLTGLKAGETDIRIYLNRARLKMIELKTKTGKLSKPQKERHAKLRKLGFQIEVVYAKTPESAAEQCVELLKGWLLEGVTKQ
jgi:hypothetical protein